MQSFSTPGISQVEVQRLLLGFDKSNATHIANLMQARQESHDTHKLLKELKHKRESVIKELN